ncbi:MAG: phosphatidylserine decarboxylase family protein [Elusimicrobiota bacterium]
MVVKEGLVIIKFFIIIAAALYIIGKYFSFPFFIWISVICLLLALFSLYFFRNPKREIKADYNEICSPADGQILEITEEDNPHFDGRVKVIRIFLSIFNVHVQRAPINGVITEVIYTKGKFLPAMARYAHLENERNEVVIYNNETRQQIIVTQIAGIIARRIVMWKKVNDILAKGELFGMIRFGSQVDIYMPMNTEILVNRPDRVKAGETIIARWTD